MHEKIFDSEMKILELIWANEPVSAKELSILAGEKITYCTHSKIGGSCHGTGDIFAACFTGILMGGKSMDRAVEIAAKFTCRCIENTRENPAHWYGVKFEPVLPELMDMLKEAAE